jgi:hypothetical protein
LLAIAERRHGNEKGQARRLNAGMYSWPVSALKLALFCEHTNRADFHQMRMYVLVLVVYIHGSSIINRQIENFLLVVFVN